MQLSPTKDRSFTLGVILLGLAYLAFELFFNAYGMFSVDEFWFAHRIYQYKDGLPYRDFAPYKTVLGYYLLLGPFLISKGILSTLLLVKNVLAFLNTGLLIVAALWLKRFFSPKAILCSLALLISSEIVLCYSTNIRVDLLGYWFCLFSFLCLLEKRFFFAGLLLGFGFITTQKSIWYIFASNCALAVYWLVLMRDLKTLARIVLFNVVIAAVIAAYVLFWSNFASADTVIQSVFLEARAMYHLDWYDSARKLFWSAITLYNPLLFLLWPLAILSVLVTFPNDKTYYRRLFVVTYAFALFCCLMPYKQVFPYYMQVTIPAFLFLYTAFFDWLFEIKNAKPSIKILPGKFLLWSIISLYLIVIIGVKVEFQLPDAYLIICLIPLLLGVYLTHYSRFQEWSSSFFLHLIALTIIFIGGIYPFMSFAIKVINANGTYQRANIEAINALLNDGSDYVAGIELIYNKTQPIPGMRHLMGPAIDYLYYPSEKIRPVMLPSLYEDPNVTVDSVIERLEKSSVKFYVNNYRIIALPERLRNYLTRHYEHWWGSIYLYAPLVSKGTEKVVVKFSSHYRLQANQPGSIVLDGKTYAANTILYLKKGTYTSKSTTNYRIKLIPDNKNLKLNPLFFEDESDKVIF